MDAGALRFGSVETAKSFADTNWAVVFYGALSRHEAR
jgi:hypothetical protein